MDSIKPQLTTMISTPSIIKKTQSLVALTSILMRKECRMKETLSVAPLSLILSKSKFLTSGKILRYSSPSLTMPWEGSWERSNTSKLGRQANFSTPSTRKASTVLWFSVDIKPTLFILNLVTIYEWIRWRKWFAISLFFNLSTPSIRCIMARINKRREIFWRLS